MLKKETVRHGLKLTLPIFFGYISIGIPFGLMVVNAGYPWWMALFMGLTIFSGTGQYIGIGLMAAGAPLPAFLITQFFVGIRHIVYGLSLLKKYDESNVGKWKYFLIFALTDETYALVTSTDVPEGEHPGQFYSFIAAMNWSYWLAGGIIGAVLGTVLPFSFAGVDFALNALFIVLMIEQIKKSGDFFPSACGIATALTAVILAQLKILPSQQVLIVSLSLGIAALILVRGVINKKTSAAKIQEEPQKEAE
jgi:4-azaleucine resistance transporter AzlC